MAKNEKLAAAKSALKEAEKNHKVNVKALATAQKSHDKTAAAVQKATEKVEKLAPKADGDE
jgi:hypothetical protein